MTRLFPILLCVTALSGFDEATEPIKAQEDWAVCYQQWSEGKNLLPEDDVNDTLVACINSSFSAKATVSHRWSILMALGQIHAEEKEFPVAIKFYEAVLSQKVISKYDGLISKDSTKNLERDLIDWNLSINRPCVAANILADRVEKTAANIYSAPFKKRLLGAVSHCETNNAAIDQTLIKPLLEEFDEATAQNYLPIVRIGPNYPRNFLKKKLEGYVIVEVTVTRLGTVESARTIEPDLPEDFHNEAMKAAEKFKYRPRLLHGETVDTDGIRIRFDFKQGR